MRGKGGVDEIGKKRKASRGRERLGLRQVVAGRVERRGGIHREEHQRTHERGNEERRSQPASEPFAAQGGPGG